MQKTHKNIAQENVGLFDLLPDTMQDATRSDTFYRNRKALLKKLYAKRQAQKAALSSNK